MIGDGLSNWGQILCPQFGLIHSCLHYGYAEVRHVSVMVKFRLSLQGMGALCSMQQSDRLSSGDRTGLKANFPLLTRQGINLN